tara:strand:+ start:10867 stop:11187 length:321 start_codon:yes stop_codon:yes gene_type:complete
MNNKPLSDFDILLKGQLTVNLPVIIIMLLTFFGLLEFADFSLQRNLLIAFILGWVSWGFLVKKWILWAMKNNVSDEKLLKIGKPGLLVWSIHTIKTVTVKNKTPWI